MNHCSVWETTLTLDAMAYARNAKEVTDDFLPAEGRGGCLCTIAGERIECGPSRELARGSSAGVEIAPLLAQLTIDINEKERLWP